MPRPITSNTNEQQVTTIFADFFCTRDKKQAAAMLLPKRFRTNADYFLLHLVRAFLRLFGLL